MTATGSITVTSGGPRPWTGHRVPRRLDGYAAAVPSTRGWAGASGSSRGPRSARIAATVARFPASRHADLWSGVGLACAYAGGVPAGTIEDLSARAGPFQPAVAQGVAFAAKARERAGNPTSHTEMACRIVCGMSAVEAAGLTDRALIGLTDGDGLPAYEVWRGRIRANWIEEAVTSMTAGEGVFRHHAARLVALAIIAGALRTGPAARAHRAPSRAGWRADSASSDTRCRSSPGDLSRTIRPCIPA